MMGVFVIGLAEYVSNIRIRFLHINNPNPSTGAHEMVAF